MLITIPIEEVKVGDKFSHNFPGNKFLREDCENSASIIREAMDVPTTAHLTPGNARTVTKDAVVKRVWVYLDMATYARVKRRKGTMVVVDRAGQNEPQNGSEDFLEDSAFAETPKHGHAGRIQSGYWEPAKNYRPTATLCFCGLSFYGKDTAQADLRFRRHFNEELKKDEYADKPADFVDEGGAASRKFSYVRSQFDRLGTSEVEGAYRLKVIGPAGETKWMDIERGDLEALRSLMEMAEGSE